MPFGYHGRILHVDLTHMRFEVEEPPEAFYREWLGGSSLALAYILRMTPSGIDALDPRNTLVLSASVLTGAPLAGLSRFTAAAKSPLTGCIGDSQCGGFFPAEFKFAGFDAVVIIGRADKPVYLWLKDGQAELRPASHLWGKTTGEVQDLLRAELADRRVEVLQCGIAGENGVRFASLMNNANRANGRTGMGAVMASKNLKAIAVRGNQKPLLADAVALRRLSRWGVENLKDKGVYMLSGSGTAGGIAWAADRGEFPTRNWVSGAFEGGRKIDGSTINQTILQRRDTCYACNVRCKPVVALKTADFEVNPTYGGPEYENLFALGSSCGIDDLSALAYANQLCNMYGMDAISCGGTIAWAMDCFEHGLIGLDDTGGLELRFGNTQAMLTLVEDIAHRRGFGEVLSLGSQKAAQVLGRGTEALLVTIKGQEMPAHMPQSKPGLGLIYAVNPFGADHQSCEHDPSYRFNPERAVQLGLENPQPELALNEEVVRYAWLTQCLYSCLDSLDICQFVFGAGWQLYDPAQLVEAVRSITGWDVTLPELLKVGEKRINMMRLFNLREGIDGAADVLPKKIFQPLVGGVSDGRAIDPRLFAEALQAYYTLAGWNPSRGTPTREKVRELGLEWALAGVAVSAFEGVDHQSGKDQ